MYKPRIFFSLGWWRVDRSDPAHAFKRLNGQERTNLNKVYEHVQRLNNSDASILMRVDHYARMTVLKRAAPTKENSQHVSPQSQATTA